MKNRLTNIISSLVLLGLPFIVPIFHVEFDVSTLLTVVSLLFAILVGFFIAASTTNYLRLQTLIANEDGCLIAMYQLCVKILPAAKNKVASAIERYVMAALDFPLTTYVKESEKEFDQFLRTIDSVRPRDKVGYELYGLLHENKTELHRTRGEVTYTARSIVKATHWFIIIALACLIALLLFALRDSSVLSSAVTGILTVALFLILRLLHQIDNNVFLEQLLSYETSQKVFPAIDRIPYYPEEALTRYGLRPSGKYRLGISPRRLGGKRRIKIVTV
jgi:ABC-type multidrug transport system fused ATPase/permease subunit